jgi:hypothetical protein
VFPQPFDLLTIPSLRRTPRFPRFHQLTNPSLPTIDLHPSRYQQLTDPSFRNPFVFSSIQNPPGVWRYFCLAVHESQVTSFHLVAASLSPLCVLFRTPFLCFQPFAASFAKTPGWEVGRTMLAEAATAHGKRQNSHFSVRRGKGKMDSCKSGD